MYGLIDSRHHNDRVERTLAEQSNRLSKFEAKISQMSKAMVYKTRKDSYIAFLDALNNATQRVRSLTTLDIGYNRHQSI
jgi:hypothetical protein